MDAKLQDSELKIMEVLWREGDCTAKHLSEVLNQEVGWNKNTTYTLIKRCIEKKAIQRSEPGFLCHALVTREENQTAQTKELIDKLYGGSTEQLLQVLGVSSKNGEEAEPGVLPDVPLKPAVSSVSDGADHSLSSLTEEKIRHMRMLIEEAREILDHM